MVVIIEYYSDICSSSYRTIWIGVPAIMLGRRCVRGCVGIVEARGGSGSERNEGAFFFGVCVF